ncbi:hypothetical protein ACFY9A_37920 [Streptomyces rubradiris]|uniref:hypothetical protein n=1 Tax=Streptomyces rubradiris TaxID=285531 RepID=UPI0036EAD473
MSTHQPESAAPAPQHVTAAPRPPLTGAQVAGIALFPLLGASLARTGMPVNDVLLLLAGCGAIGAATIAAAGGGRRLLTALAAAAVRAASGTDPGK